MKRYIYTLTLAFVVSMFVASTAVAWPLPDKFSHLYPPGLQERLDKKLQEKLQDDRIPPGIQKKIVQNEKAGKEPQPTEPDGDLPPVEELPVSEEPYVNPNVPVPSEEHEPHVEEPPAFEGGGRVHVYNGRVLYYVQNFANVACNRYAACHVSTYRGHPPAQKRALDFLVARRWGQYAHPAGIRKGNRVARFALRARDNRSVYYVIWRNRIAGSWSGYRWEAYGGRGATDGHYDHVHVGFFKR